MATTSPAQELDVWIGTTTPRGGQSKGIYYARLDTEEGRLTTPQLAAEVQQPGFLTLAPGGNVLYATATIDGEGSVAAYRIEHENGHKRLERINAQPTGDGGATHVSTDRTGRVLVSAQYGGGSVSSYPLDENGAIGPARLVRHSGSAGVVADRQEAPHPHWTGTSPDNRFMFVPDLGLDQVKIYRLDAARAELVPHGAGDLPPGSGPRHMVFDPDGNFIYVLNELALTVTAFAYDAAEGTMNAIQTISTIPDRARTKETFLSASEIRMHPTGKFLYAANRGHDTITVFEINAADGQLSFVECEPIHGSYPRNFNLDPHGKWLLAAGRDTNSISLFAISDQSGKLTFVHRVVPVPSPICVVVDPGD